MLKKILLYYNTIKYLKSVQIKYQLYYKLKKYFKTGKKTKEIFDESAVIDVTLDQSIESYTSYLGDNTFEFLNRKKKFNNDIDWNFSDFGKLWTYNLNYFEYLHQTDISLDEGIRLINDFIDNIDSIDDGLEPFPISLRIVNWIKYLLINNVVDSKTNKSLFYQSFLLLDKIEYHIQGNHLLENAFALLYAGIFFNNKKLSGKAEEILSIQLEEQILADGAHFELSPMYHQLIFYRLLDAINLVINSGYNNKNILAFLTNKAGMMYSWLENITFNNGDIPLFNDSAGGIAPTSEELFKYAKRLGIHNSKLSLKESGYRKFIGKHYEMVVDIGKIGPDYIPGHGHNDIFGFVLYIRNKPVIVDTGTSVYGNNPERRLLERSTESHNTVKVGDYEQAEIWSDFRVSRRSFPKIITDEKNRFVVEYQHFSKKYTHRREFVFSETHIDVIDTVFSQLKSVSHLHFDSDIYPGIDENKIDLSYCKIEFDNGKAGKKEYLLSKGFGKLQSSKKVEIEFYEKMRIKIDVI